MGAALMLEQLTKRYGTGAYTTTALDSLTLTIPAGQFVSVMGPSGSGKSTMLNLIAGLDTPTSGRVSIGGEDIGSLSDDARSDLRLHRVGIVFQSFNLFPTFTLEENVVWPLEFQGVRSQIARERAHRALDHVDLPEALRGRRPAELSGGEQQRVAIARALVIDPELLLADEPTGNLDSHTGQVILDLLRKLNRGQGMTVVMVTHSAFAATYGHRTIELQDGRIERDVQAPPTSTGRVVPLRD